MMKKLLTLSLIVLTLSSTGCSSRKTAVERPLNLLFIMTDQQRFDALSFAGNDILETPNLDRLAREGAWFKNAYTPCAVCVPARASILTGHRVASTGVISNSLAYVDEEMGIMPMNTYDEILADNGYTCEYYGKWHTPTFRARVYENPVTVAGKSSSELGPGKKRAYLNYLAPKLPARDLLPGEFLDTYTERPYLAHPIDKRYDLKSRGEDAEVRVGQSDIHGVISIPTEYHISAFDGSKTIEALERLKDSTFSVTCSFHHPHPPYLGAKSYVDLFPPGRMPVPESIYDEMKDSPYLYRKRRTNQMYSDPEKIKYFISEYYAMVKEVDDWVGKILDKLDELGLSENTLVIFTSDHGEMLGNHGMRGKFNFYEESSHIPLMIRFPGQIEPATVVDSYVSTVNLFATILDYLDMPEQQSDGYSMRGLIEGTDEENGNYVVTEWLSELEKAPSHMVLKDGWKLMLPDSSANHVIKALYDLNTDPYEMKNLLGNHPEANTYSARVTELETCFREWGKR
jgi:arylsulfatase A-like enzyme